MIKKNGLKVKIAKNNEDERTSIPNSLILLRIWSIFGQKLVTLFASRALRLTGGFIAPWCNWQHV
jgi:hypothetical protein